MPIEELMRAGTSRSELRSGEHKREVPAVESDGEGAGGLFKNVDKAKVLEKGFDWALEQFGTEEDGTLNEAGMLANIGKWSVAGAAFGPAGAIVGGLVGAVDGFFSSKKAREKKRKQETEYVRNVGQSFLDQAEALGDRAEATYEAGDSLIREAASSTDSTARAYRDRSAFGVESRSRQRAISNLSDRREGIIGETSRLVQSSVDKLEGLADTAKNYGEELRHADYTSYDKAKSYTAEFKTILEEASDE